jgi:ubiquinone/menaquinone biosynthesis C-methylase UbiE
LVWNEKLLEHWIAAQRLRLMDYQPTDIYIDVAAANSPWAKALRERLGISAFAMDLCKVGSAYQGLDHYRTENATATSFADGSVSGVSLLCAYEMFTKDDDINLLVEMKRILKPNGKIIIEPIPPRISMAKATHIRQPRNMYALII